MSPDDEPESESELPDSDSDEEMEAPERDLLHMLEWRQKMADITIEMEDLLKLIGLWKPWLERLDLPGWFTVRLAMLHADIDDILDKMPNARVSRSRRLRDLHLIITLYRRQCIQGSFHKLKQVCDFHPDGPLEAILHPDGLYHDRWVGERTL